MEMGAGDYLKLQMYKQARSRKKKPMTAKRKRTAKMNRDLADKKQQLWDKAREFGGWPICRLCAVHIYNPAKSEICHESSKGLGGGKRYDGKVFLGHAAGNSAQGGQSLAAYKSGKSWEELKRLCGV